jgi:LysM repeat protein
MSERVPTSPPPRTEVVEGGIGTPADQLDAARAICPYLVAASGDWRSLAPAREHVCAAVDPPAALAFDKQRRLCLGAAHVDCATYVAARHAIEHEPAGRLAGTGPGRWPIPRTAPVVIDRGGPSLASLRIDRTVVQAGLVLLMVVAFAVLALARLSAPDPGPAGTASPSPSATGAASMDPSPGPSRRPSPTPAASPSTGPTNSPSAGPTAAPTTSASAATSTRTYTVRSGDTLSAIAARFGTTIAVLRDLNDIADPSLLRVGQDLRIP